MRVGILGGGQLGRMLALAGYPLGMRFGVLDPAPDACAGQLAQHTQAAFDDLPALAALAADHDVITYEFENVPVVTVETLAASHVVRPGVAALGTAQDRVAEKELFRTVGLETAAFAEISAQSDIASAVDRVGLPAILKTRRLGYDGKGQASVASADECVDAWIALGQVPCIVESRIAFERELSLIAARAVDGTTAFYAWTENEHRASILSVSRAPALPVDEGRASHAQASVVRMLEVLDYVGVLAVEFFDIGGRLLANEFAPRVHNTGHWTMNGAVTSQFENHVRAVCGLPLGSTTVRGFAGMVNLIGGAPSQQALLERPETHVHLYGKAPRPGRKIGHLNVLHDSVIARDAAVSKLVALTRATDER